MENNNYVSVGNIIEQERLRRQAQIAKGVSSDVYDHIEKAHQDDLNSNIEKSDNLTRFETDIQDLNKAETELLLHKIQRQLNADSKSMLLKAMKSIAINHYNDIEKARHGIYEDNAKNRKLNRVGQEYGHASERKESIDKQPKKQEEAGGGIQSYAAKASDETLKRAADDENAKPEVREAAKKELEKRNGSTEQKNDKASKQQHRNNKYSNKTATWVNNAIELKTSYDKASKDYYDARKKVNKELEETEEFNAYNDFRDKVRGMDDEEYEKYWDEEDKITSAMNKKENELENKYNLSELKSKFDAAQKEYHDHFWNNTAFDHYVKLRKQKNLSEDESKAMKLYEELSFNPD